MTDEQLLELAAKVAGVSNPVCYQWNPLDDDGDAFRLVVKLGLLINPRPNSKSVFVGYKDGDGIVESGDDLYAATRRAIVLAAANLVEYF